MPKGKISEIFNSIQGEGLYAGERQVFVRFFGCNLDCRFCDTKLKYFSEFTPEDLLDKIKIYYDASHSIAFTGGEPLLQANFLKEILKLTHERGFKNYLETNGTLPDALAEVIDKIDIVAMDLKLPSSTGLGDFWGEHRKFLKISSRKEVFLKAVVCQATQQSDLARAISIIQEINPAVPLVLQPNSYENQILLAEKLEHYRALCLENNINTCIIPQIHKIVGVK